LKLKGENDMLRRVSLILSVLVLSLLVAVPVYANPGKPTFEAALYGDGEAWGTKGAAALPAPNENNLQSFDKLFVITNSNNPGTQLPVAEAAPGNPDYNGGRWFTHTVVWTEAGFDAHGTAPILMSYDDIMLHESLGHLMITPGTFEGGPPAYFECPLLPVK
jgi:hypothetical protein